MRLTFIMKKVADREAFYIRPVANEYVAYAKRCKSHFSTKQFAVKFMKTGRCLLAMKNGLHEMMDDAGVGRLDYFTAITNYKVFEKLPSTAKHPYMEIFLEEKALVKEKLGLLELENRMFSIEVEIT